MLKRRMTKDKRDRWKKHLETTGHRLLDPDSYDGQFSVYSWFCEKCQTTYQRSYKTEKSKPECPGCSEIRLGNRWTQESAAEELRSRGFELLSDFKNATTPLEIQDLETGAIYRAKLKPILAGADPRRKSGDHLTRDQHFEFAKSRGFEILDFKLSKKEKTTIKCLDCGEVTQVKWVMWRIATKKRGSKGCKTCALKARSREGEEATEVLASKGYSLVGGASGKVKVTDPLLVLCNRGHQFNTSLKRLKGCPHCNNEDKIRAPEGLLESLRAEGYSWKGAYSGHRERVEVTCPKGHTWSPKWSYLANNNRCPDCAKDAVLATSRSYAERAARLLESEGYTITSDPGLSLGKNHELEWVCPLGHFGKTRVCYIQNGCRCKKCSFTTTAWEKATASWLTSQGIRFEEKDRSLIAPFELDFVLPDLGVALELSGIRFHSEEYKGKAYHQEKEARAKAAGYRLVTIFEPDWLVLKAETLANTLETEPFDAPVLVREENDRVMVENGVGKVVGSFSLVKHPLLAVPELVLLSKSLHARLSDLLAVVGEKYQFYFKAEDRYHSLRVIPDGFRQVYQQTDPQLHLFPKYDKPVDDLLTCKKRVYKVWSSGYKVVSNTADESFRYVPRPQHWVNPETGRTWSVFITYEEDPLKDRILTVTKIKARGRPMAIVEVDELIKEERLVLDSLPALVEKGEIK